MGKNSGNDYKQVKYSQTSINIPIPTLLWKSSKYGHLLLPAFILAYLSNLCHFCLPRLMHYTVCCYVHEMMTQSLICASITGFSCFLFPNFTFLPKKVNITVVPGIQFVCVGITTYGHICLYFIMRWYDTRLITLNENKAKCSF